ncbi:GNAT family N-acetyltransferase [Planomicrobium sp. CPCC 101110]|uniref:GNAT family N-acetyltransferase n=1 Tax=Planomicrobium sp. CPCC 101110 TaxID=2599619 RepID=UPI0011B8331F|nr:GNAT family N-acetyltransferase [Planomicrobium sp. CPCC 101110]TWT24775.1 N-acetyltransferase [Planomicrobium sp. CPCC 101110]
MDMKHENNKISFLDNSEEKAFISYVPDGEVLTVDHTVVSPELEGQGIGKKLVAEIVQYARDEGKSIDAQCPFANAIIEKTPEFQDILAK